MQDGEQGTLWFQIKSILYVLGYIYVMRVKIQEVDQYQDQTMRGCLRISKALFKNDSPIFINGVGS